MVVPEAVIEQAYIILGISWLQDALQGGLAVSCPIQIEAGRKSLLEHVMNQRAVAVIISNEKNSKCHVIFQEMDYRRDFRLTLVNDSVKEFQE
jgi:hypothetical protein